MWLVEVCYECSMPVRPLLINGGFSLIIEGCYCAGLMCCYIVTGKVSFVRTCTFKPAKLIMPSVNHFVTHACTRVVVIH